MNDTIEGAASQAIHNTPALPDGWHWKALNDLCVEDRTIIEPDSPRARQLRYLGLEHVESVSGCIIQPSEPNSDEGRSTAFYFMSSHVLYGKLRPYLNKVALPEFEGRCTTELIPLLPRPGVSRNFLAWLLRRPETVQAAMQEKTGARMPRASMKHILSLPVPVPGTQEEQQRIASQIASRLGLISQAKKLVQEQAQLLDALTQRALAEFPYSIEINSQDE